MSATSSTKRRIDRHRPGRIRRRLHARGQCRKPRPQRRRRGQTAPATTLDNVINGNGENNQLFGGGGNDTLNGDDGNDLIDGGAGNDTLNGGDDNDTIIGGAGNDTIDVGGGVNTIVYNAANFGNDVDQQLRLR